jgi:hypothetical protein
MLKNLIKDKEFLQRCDVSVRLVNSALKTSCSEEIHDLLTFQDVTKKKDILKRIALFEEPSKKRFNICNAHINKLAIKEFKKHLRCYSKIHLGSTYLKPHQKTDAILIKEDFSREILADENWILPFGGHICGPCRHTYYRRKLAKEEKLKSFGANPEVQERKKPDEKPFACKICKKGFKRKQSLKIHIETIHEGKKPFKSFIDDQDVVSTARVRKTPVRFADSNTSLNLTRDSFTINHDMEKSKTWRYLKKKRKSVGNASFGDLDLQVEEPLPGNEKLTLNLRQLYKFLSTSY